MQFDLFDTTHNRILQVESYTGFKGLLETSGCKRCGLWKARANIVVDRGNPKAPILIVSERPGSNEDRLGVAFVGRAGELLDKVLASIGLDPNRDILVTNVVKCMPPDDRSPHAEEVHACLPYLDRQVQLQKPRIILLLGAIAHKYVSGMSEFSMEKQAGRIFTLSRYNLPAMVLYHTAFLLRDPRFKKTMWTHMKQLRRFLHEEAIIQIS